LLYAFCSQGRRGRIVSAVTLPAIALAAGAFAVGGTAQAALATLGTDWTLRATAGFDNVTGVGSPAPAYPESFGRSPASR
jgi:hypothetical protein